VSERPTAARASGLRWLDTVWARAGLGAFAVLASSGVVQLIVLRARIAAELARIAETQGIALGLTTLSDELRVFTLAALFAPSIVGAALAVLVMLVMIRRRSRMLILGMERVAAGDFEADLPPPPEADLRPLRDAFDRMRLALRDATRRLAHQDAQRRRLFADLAHELATPISTQLGLVEVLRGPRGAQPEERARLLTALETETERLERLVSDLRELATLDDPDVAVDRRGAELDAVVARAIEPLRAQADEDAPRIVLARAAVRARIDEGRIAQVVVNLLTNALRHAPPASTIHVEVGPTSDGGARLVVEDEGPGVPEEVLPQLGERLLRLDASRDRRTGGHGLGLSIVQAIVHRHGGSLAFSRGPRRGGLRVEVLLPRSE
jgi:signal transduction histidine kinase